MGVRTLQNKLKAEGRVFSEILEKTREQVAKNTRVKTRRWRTSPDFWASRPRAPSERPPKNGPGLRRGSAGKCRFPAGAKGAQLPGNARGRKLGPRAGARRVGFARDDIKIASTATEQAGACVY
jgi:hypothetical protein